MKHRILFASAVVSVALIGGACTAADDPHAGHDANPAAQQPAGEVKKAVAQIEPTKGNTAKGTVTLTQEGDKVTVVVEMTGLTPNSKHAIHVHEGTECGEDGMKARGHYNPDKHPHGLPDADHDKKHAGDWGNLSADAEGKATLKLVVDDISINGKRNPVLGRAVIVHEKADDGGQPTGNAGGRIGCGIIKATK